MWKELIVRIQTDFGAAFHGFREYVCTQLARQYGGDGFIEKEPNVPAVARPGPLQGSGHVHLLTCFQECARILLPRCFVKIGGQEETGLIPKHRIDAHHEFPTLVVVTAEMPTNYFVGYAKKTLVRTFGALDSRFLANSPDPLIAASWRIASSACLTAMRSVADKHPLVHETASGREQFWPGR